MPIRTQVISKSDGSIWPESRRKLFSDYPTITHGPVYGQSRKQWFEYFPFINVDLSTGAAADSGARVATNGHELRSHCTLMIDRGDARPYVSPVSGRQQSDAGPDPISCSRVDEHRGSHPASQQEQQLSKSIPLLAPPSAGHRSLAEGVPRWRAIFDALLQFGEFCGSWLGGSPRELGRKRAELQSTAKLELSLHHDRARSRRHPASTIHSKAARKWDGAAGSAGGGPWAPQQVAGGAPDPAQAALLAPACQGVLEERQGLTPAAPCRAAMAHGRRHFPACPSTPAPEDARKHRATRELVLSLARIPPPIPTCAAPAASAHAPSRRSPDPSSYICLLPPVPLHRPAFLNAPSPSHCNSRTVLLDTSILAANTVTIL
ncbi:hypothetical protein CC78DRAFT_574744 [Lojkania enalia]|uniref:Uncharacterized protein n=1 Tax=Lojkania enalia TaxID=147567 RepID=A0A9P4TP61_9PLEO|nr:hypothetical protein CC78DRAFT_574744 [Didymosphaeria enalia]